MSKRRSRKRTNQPNLPQETLARARREAGLEEEPDEAEVAAEPLAVVDAAQPAQPLPPVQRRKRRAGKEVDPSELTQAEIAERLANPTKTVIYEQLQAQYSYVLADLRSMGLLVGALFVLMILAAQFF
ncbi:MAG TPA: hypothetical protein VKY59_01600 [Spirillospora sp.]|nr:hypothetical protein [Spirillospora sp.]